MLYSLTVSVHTRLSIIELDLRIELTDDLYQTNHVTIAKLDRARRDDT